MIESEIISNCTSSPPSSSSSLSPSSPSSSSSSSSSFFPTLATEEKRMLNGDLEQPFLISLVVSSVFKVSVYERKS